MVTNNQYYISEWIGFSFALISLILSCLTSYIIYEMCRESETPKSSRVISDIILHASETVNPTHAQSGTNLSRVEQNARKDSTATSTTISGIRSKSGTTKFNGYLLLISSMACCQILYDLNYILGISDTYSGCLTWRFLDMLGGLSVPLWTNILSFIIYYIVNFIKSLDIFRNYFLFFFIAVVLPLVLAIVELSLANVIVKTDDEQACVGGSDYYIFNDIYYWGRVASIGLNVVIFVVISVKLRYMAINEGANSHHSAAIFALVRRMKYYPIAQVFIRSGAAWNEYNDYQYQTFTSELITNITSPSSGAVYFFLFLYMQPRAYSTFCRIVRQWFCSRSNEAKVSEHTGEFYLREDSCTDMNDLDEDELESLIESRSASQNTFTRQQRMSFSVAAGTESDWGICLSESGRSEQSLNT